MSTATIKRAVAHQTQRETRVALPGCLPALRGLGTLDPALSH